MTSNVSKRLCAFDVQLLVQDPVSSYPSTRFRRVESETSRKAANLAKRQFNKDCAPVYVKQIVSVVEAR